MFWMVKCKTILHRLIKFFISNSITSFSPFLYLDFIWFKQYKYETYLLCIFRLLYMKDRDIRSGNNKISRREFLIGVGALVLAGCEPTASKITKTFDTIGASQTPTPIKPSETPSPVKTETPTPTITPVAKTETEEVVALEFSEKIGLGFKETYMAKVEEMEIPIGIGLEYWITKRSKQQIKEVHIAPDVVDLVGDFFMQACFLRYSKIMGNDVTYEEYIDLVKQGKGNIKIAGYNEASGNNERFPSIQTVDPREGFAYTFAEQKLPISYNKDLWSFYVGVDGRGKLLYATDHFTEKYLSSFEKAVNLYGRSLVDNVIIKDQISNLTLTISSFEDRCIESTDISRSCGLVGPTQDWWLIHEPIQNELIKYENKERDDPLFTIVR